MKLQNVAINSYLNGYAAIPVIIACKEHGLFKALDSAKQVPFTGLVRELNANSGELRVAFRILEYLNFISRDKNDKYSLLPASDVHKKIPGDIMKLMCFPMNYLKSNKKSNLKKWIALSKQGWDINDVVFAGYLDGMLIVPLFLALRDKNLISRSEENQGQSQFTLDSDVNQEILDYLVSQGWGDRREGIAYLTDSGRSILEELHRASAAKYRPMLINIAQVIFNGGKPAFKRDLFNCEQHADSTLGVTESEFKQEEYLFEIEEIVLSIFNQKPYSEQPGYIAQMGCGDGRLLKKIYEIVKTKSLRGQVLDEYPVKLIGIDINEGILEKTAQTLQDIDHIVLTGNVGEPEKMINDLQNSGVTDVEKVLHVRSRQDHRRCYNPPSGTTAAANRSKLDDGVYFDSKGNCIPAALVTQSLAEHFKRWSSLPGDHGIILLEEHCLDLKTAREFNGKTENMFFDACHGFSQQMPVEADRFLMAAAYANLFPKPGFLRKHPQTMPFTRITINHFERRDYRVRYAQEKDLPVLEQLEIQCWEPALRSSVSAIKKRLKQYPKGQLVLEFEDRVVGVIYTQRIASPEDIKKSTMRTVERLHRTDDAIVQLLAVNVLPELQHRNLGDELLEYMLQLCTLSHGIEKVVAVTRCRDYHKHTGIDLQEYIGHRNEQGRLVDTILRFHELHGAQVKELVPGYRSRDTVNRGCGVLIEYDLNNRIRQDIMFYDNASRKAITEDNEFIKDYIVRSIKSVLGPDREKGFALDRPMMEMGLDSPDLLELKERLTYKYRIKLRADFFFKYKTPERVIAYLQENLEQEKAESISKVNEGREEDNAYIHNALKQDIAVIGVSCRLPGNVANKEQLWALLEGGKDAIGDLPQDRWDWPDYIDPQNQHKGIDRGGFLDDIAGFDASFFRISPKEAELMDPQQRIMLELCWECLEDAGYSAKRVSGSKTGVFIGASGSDYQILLDKSLEEMEAYYNIGTSMAMLPNRISYFYGFYGPSLQIDTACSSSLVAVHEAVKSLRTRECVQALVGGINIMCHPSASIAFYKAGMLSRDGRCKTFDKDANGYVRSEGAVMILLKPLPQAIADNDTVYAVIKGTAINHGGQASGLTVPNPSKQAALLIEAYKTTGIGPETLGYIEAHGTGTSLGDPIEASGLKEAFDQLSPTSVTAREPYCGLGSIKTNLGHLEAAAGIAGLLKVILSLQNRVLPASLNFNELNPHIFLDETPFYIVDNTRPWELPIGQRLRRAGVSSFGSGGANAHVVLEEAPLIAKDSSRDLPAYLICLSAKTESALRQKEIDFLDWLKEEGHRNSLSDISASLLMTREHFKLRAAYIVRDFKEIPVKFNEVWEKGTAEKYFGNRSYDHGEIESPVSGDLGQAILNELKAKKKMSKREYANKLAVLAELYSKGFDLEWRYIFSDNPVQCIKLPVYPFCRKRYWVPETVAGTQSANKAVTDDVIHPLLRKNTSDLSEQRFTSVFAGQEFFLTDHVVKGEKMLPGVAYLEMARAAVEEVAGVLRKGNEIIEFHDVLWARPIVVKDEPVEAHIGLYPDEDGKIAYKIYSYSAADYGKPLLHSEGTASLVEVSRLPRLDIAAIRDKGLWDVVLPEKCYEAYRMMGLEYGPGHRGIEEIYLNEDEILARLHLPHIISDTLEEYVLHPSLMDAALQAAIALIVGFGADSGTPSKPPLPFILEKMEILGKCTPGMWVYLQYSQGIKDKDKTRKVDIDLCDSLGNICVRMKGFSMRVLEGDIQSGNAVIPSYPASGDSLVGEIKLVPVWELISPEKGPAFPAAADRVMLIGGDKNQRSAIERYYPRIRIAGIQPYYTIDSIATELETYGPINHIIWIAPSPASEFMADDSLIEEQDHGVLYCFRLIKALLQIGYGSKELGWTVITVQTQSVGKNDPVDPVHAGLYGLVGSMAKEYRNWSVRMVDLEAAHDWPLTQIFGLPADPQGNALIYRRQEWYRQKLTPVKYMPTSEPVYRQGGVYVVIGGAGGIGEVWTEYMIRNYCAQIVWIGRRKKDKVIQAKLDRLSGLGPAPVYISTDAADRKYLQRAYVKIKQIYPRIHGVIHAAIVLSDQSLANMEEERFKAALSAKVDVSVRMAQVFYKEPLDFMLFFSSILAFTRAPGQSNYASGCTFTDIFAHHLRRRLACAVKVINWGYWGSVGIVASKAYQERMKQAGIGSIEPTEAMEALERLLAGPIDQIIHVKTARSQAMIEIHDEELITVYSPKYESSIEKVKNTILSAAKNKRVPHLGTLLSPIEERLAYNVQRALINTVSNLLAVRAEDIDASIDLKEFGLDSYKLVDFADKVNEEFGLELTPDMVSSHYDLSSLAAYLALEYQSVFKDIFN